MAICSALNCSQRATIKILNPTIIMSALLIAVSHHELEQSPIEMDAHGSP